MFIARIGSVVSLKTNAANVCRGSCINGVAEMFGYKGNPKLLLLLTPSMKAFTSLRRILIFILFAGVTTGKYEITQFTLTQVAPSYVCYKVEQHHEDCSDPVSYTHLDVYKRQSELCYFIFTCGDTSK